MTQTIGGIEGLGAAMTGVVVAPDDLDYDQARRVWNADIDHHPALIARCTTSQDVAEAVRFAQDQGLELAVRCVHTAFPGTRQLTEAW